MKKNSKNHYQIKISTLVWSIFIIFLIGWLFWPLNYSSEETIYGDTSNGKFKIGDKYSEIYEVHWDHMPLTYSIKDNANCGDLQINKMLEAFEILENKTNYVRFVESDELNPDLIIQCLDLRAIRDSYREEINRLKNSPKLKCIEKLYNYDKKSISSYEEGGLNKSENLFINASREYTKPNTTWKICYLNRDDINQDNIEIYGLDDWRDISSSVLGDARPNIVGNIIINATINLYAPEEGWRVCSKFPVKEMHELLHVFSFGHSYEPPWDPYEGYSDWDYARDIMFPSVHCLYQIEIQDKYVSCLEYIYSNGEVGFCSDVNFL